MHARLLPHLRAYLRTRPVAIASSPEPDEGPAFGPCRTPRENAADTTDEEEGFSNLAPLRLFPEVLYIAPALSNSIKQSWALLNQGNSGKGSAYVPSAWTLHDGNLFSFVDPETSRL